MSALELLKQLAEKHDTTLRRLKGQLAGVERAIAEAQAKLDAVNEAIQSLTP